MRTWLKNKINELYPGVDFDVLTPPDEKMGDYSVNLAFVLAKSASKGRDLASGGKEGENPKDVGKKLVSEFLADKEFKKYFDKIELAGSGFVNFYLSEDFLREKLVEISGSKNYGYGDMLKGKKIVIEFTDPNPFKLFHIGHLMSNTIGEAIARLYEASGAKVTRVNYQGDVGLHVAKAIWGMKYGPKSMPKEGDSINKKIEFLGNAYVYGAHVYDSADQGDQDRKKAIEDINKKVYDKSDPETNRLYESGRSWSLEYFSKIYEKLGTKFDQLFFESEAGKDGLKIISDNKNIFTESDGALIFKGEDYGLHSRVFINSQGLPTYEAKELGLNKKKFEMYSPDISVVVTGNEINDYFKVLLKVMELIMPEVAKVTTHIGHGMMRLSAGKMSSRTGNVITAESFIEELVARVRSVDGQSSAVKSEKDYEAIAIGAIKYSILKQGIGQDIIFDSERALSIKGDSAPYIQYANVRLNSVFEKSEIKNPKADGKIVSLLKQPEEFLLMKKITRLPEIIEESARDHQINRLALYVYELASVFHNFYEKHRVVQDDKELEKARLVLCSATKIVLGQCLMLMGISAPEKM